MVASRSTSEANCQTGSDDADLARIVEVWSTLTSEQRAAVLAIVEG